MKNYPYKLKRTGVSSHLVIGQLLTIEKPNSILDVGCGPGFLAKSLKYKPKKLIGLDKVDFKKLKNYTKVYQINLDEDKWTSSLGNKRFEVVVLADILEHLENPQKVLDRIKILLKNDGFIIVSVPNGGFWLMRLASGLRLHPKMDRGIFDKTHKHNFKRVDLYRMLRESGFRIREVSFTEVPLPVFFISNLFFKIFPNIFAYQIIVKADLGV